jgi:hypothetical protein
MHQDERLVETLREQVAYLQGVIATRDRELEQRAEEICRRDAALEREQQLAAIFADRLRELEAPAPRESPETVENTSGSATERSATERSGTEGPHAGAQGMQNESRRPWWRRVFGG